MKAKVTTVSFASPILGAQLLEVIQATIEDSKNNVSYITGHKKGHTIVGQTSPYATQQLIVTPQDGSVTIEDDTVYSGCSVRYHEWNDECFAIGYRDFGASVQAALESFAAAVKQRVDSHGADA